MASDARWLFGLAAAANLMVAAWLALAQGLFVAVLRLDPISGSNVVITDLAAVLIATFGYGYLRIALDAARFRPLIHVGAVGKLAAVATVAASAIVVPHVLVLLSFMSGATLCSPHCSSTTCGVRARPAPSGSRPSPAREPTMELHLRGKRVVITGASKGIGAAAAQAFAEEGCDVVLVARDRSALEALAGRLSREHNVEAVAHPADLRSSDNIARLAEAAGDVDILVNNAGDIPGGALEAIDEAAWRHAWDLKVFGYINLTRLIYAKMKARGSGVIINDIGAAGERFDANYITGAAGNAALMTFTRALGGRSLDDGIRVVGINPGPVETGRIVTLLRTRAEAQFGDANRYPELMARYPLGRAAKPREIADVMLFLASVRSAYTSGVIVTVDGGLSARG